MAQMVSKRNLYFHVRWNNENGFLNFRFFFLFILDLNPNDTCTGILAWGGVAQGPGRIGWSGLAPQEPSICI
jgi:hypothetical protein